MALTKDSILAANDSAPVSREVPEWGGTVCIRVMSGSERDNFERQQYQAREAAGGDITAAMENFRSSLLVKCLSDDQGNRLFTDEDIAPLGKKSSKVLDELYDVAKQINGMSKKDVEELTKKS